MEKLWLRIEISCVPRGNKGFRNLLNVNFVRKKIGSPREQYISFPLVTLECCCLPGKLQKQRKFATSFVYKHNEIPAIFSNLGDWRAARTRACLLRFSALKTLIAIFSVIHNMVPKALAGHVLISAFRLIFYFFLLF